MRFGNGGFLERTHQVCFARTCLLLELFDPFLRAFFRPQLLALDQVVVPVEFLAEIANRSHQLALPRVGHAGNMHRVAQQIHEGTGFCLLDVAESFLKAVGSAQAKVDQVLVDLQLVLEERDL